MLKLLFCWSCHADNNKNVFDSRRAGMQALHDYELHYNADEEGTWEWIDLRAGEAGLQPYAKVEQPGP